ncbi:MAG: glycosyltransferase family 39 protein [Flavobacteriales bacterium]|nr:MAG: glycosyltransferase family 39 protein [Flavobacteriales bacterium]
MDRRRVLIAWAGLLVVHALGVLVPVMDVDAAQYASMSAQMLREGNWLQVFDREVSYLDKPPLVFWLSACSIHLFGQVAWAYKLPSVLFAFAGCWGVFKFTRLHHDGRTAHLAALMYGSSVALLQMTNDVRCDTLLTANVILATWAGMAWLGQRQLKHLLLGALFIGLAMLAKGPIGAVVPGLAIGGHLAITGQWRALSDARLLLVPLVIGAMLAPMCYALYLQHGWQGVQFFFWEQSFGRITGSNRWHDDSTGFFFLHTLVWVAAPWTLFIVYGTVKELFGVVRRKSRVPEYASLCGAVLTLTALSFSHYKLPHYLFVLMPFACVIGARTLVGRHARIFDLLQLLLALLTFGLGSWLALVAFPNSGTPWAVAAGLCCIVALVVYARSREHARALWPTFIITIGAALVINGHFYPTLLRYQAGTQVGDKVRELGVAQADLRNFATLSRALDFHAGYRVEWLRDIREASESIRPGRYVYCNDEGREALIRAGHPPLQEWSFPAFPVQVVTIDFLLPARRPSVVGTHYLLRY